MKLLLNLYNKNSKVLDIDKSCTVNELKTIIENEEMYPIEIQRLICNTKLMYTGTLSDNGLIEGDIVDVQLPILGGGNRYKKASSRMRWKWVKKRTRRLQRKRRKMRLRAK